MDYQSGFETGIFSGIILMAFFHGILLATIFLFHAKLNAKSNKFLALSILGICVILGYEFVYWVEIEERIPTWIQYLPLYIRTTIPVGIYFFVIYLVQPKYGLSRFDKLGFVAIGLEVLLESAYIPVNLLIDNADEVEILEHNIVLLGGLLSILVAIVFLPLALKKVNLYQTHLYENYSTTNGKSLGWLRIFLILIHFMMVFWIISFVQFVLEDLSGSEITFEIVTIGLVVLLFWVGYSIIIKHSWFEIVPLNEEQLVKKTNESKLSVKTDTYHQNLLDLMDMEKLYEDPDLTLDRLSEHLQISGGYLSQIIKEKEGKNFFEFVNAYRVKSVKEKLLNLQYQDYTIMAAAMESGFNSKSTFNTVFKKFTGLTPSAFKKMHG